MAEFSPKFVPKKVDKEIISIRIPLTTLEIIDAKAAEIGVAHLVAEIKVVRHMVEYGALAAKRLEQLHRGVFADIVGHA